MADLTLNNSGYQTGSIDTASTLVNNVSATDAQHINGPNSGVLQIEAILGSGTGLIGSVADLNTRLAVEHNADGTQKTLTVPKGGTGLVSVVAGGIPLGNGTSALFASAGRAEEVPFFQGSATASWTKGLVFHAPASVASGSTLAHGGTTVISVNQNLSGVNIYDNLTINAGVTVTVVTRSVFIVANNTITINGTISAGGAGGPAGAGSTGNGAVGGAGSEQPGGGGGGGSSGTGATGGAVMLHGISLQAGGAGGGTSTNGTAGTSITGNNALRTLMGYTAMGGAGGGGGGGNGAANSGGAGGAGGGSIVLIAPNVVIGAAATLSTTGGAGVANAGGADTGGGGGGGAGNIYILCRTYLDNGGTFTTTGGAAGPGNGGGQSGGAGANGILEVFRYGP